ARLRSLDEGHLDRAQALARWIFVDQQRNDAVRNWEIFLGAVAEHPAHIADPDGDGHARSGLVLPQTSRPIVADPDTRRQPPREADEPRVRVVVGRPGLRGDRTAQRLRGLPCAALDDTAKHVGDDVSGLRSDGVSTFRYMLFKELALRVGDVADGDRRHPRALIRE